jgi:ribonuclease HII
MLEGDYSVYQFEKHVGYGTVLHKQMLILHGVSDLHRLTFKPVKALL